MSEGSGLAIGEGLLARNTLWNLLGRGVPLLAALACIPVLTRGMGEPAFGVLALVWALLSYLSELGFGRAVTKFAAVDREGARPGSLSGVVWTTAAFQAALGAVAGAVVWLAAPPLAERVVQVPAALAAGTRDAFRLCGLAAPILMVPPAFRGALEARQRFGLVNAVRLPAGLANFVLPVAAVIAGWSLEGVVALMVGGRALVVAAYGALAVGVLPELRRPRWITRGSGARRILSFGGWASVSTVVSPVLVYVDRFLLGALSPVRAVAFYTPPFELSHRLLILPANFAATFFPAASTLEGEGETGELRRLSARGVTFTVLAVGLPAVLLAGGASDILRLWLGPEYAAEGAAALTILAFGVVANAAAYVPLSVLQGVERPDLPAKFHLAELPVYLLLAWGLISRWGVPGAAAAWTVRVTVDAGLLFWACGWAGGVRWADYRRHGILGAAALVAGAGALAALAVPLLPSLWLRAGLLATILAAAAHGAWHHVLGAEDRRRLLSFIRHAIRAPRT